MASINFRIDNGHMNATAHRGGKPKLVAITQREGDTFEPFLSLSWGEYDHDKDVARQIDVYLSRGEAESLIDSLHSGIDQLTPQKD